MRWVDSIGGIYNEKRQIEKNSSIPQFADY
jgi:hypothetical protein